MDFVKIRENFEQKKIKFKQKKRVENINEKKSIYNFNCLRFNKCC